MEHIISFGQSFAEQNTPFYIEMAGITYPDPKYHIVRSNSHIHCFEYVMKGEGIVTVDGKTNYPCAGDVYILPKGTNHNYCSEPNDPFEKIWFNINGSLCDELIHIYGIIGILIVKNFDAFDFFREFLDICENKELSVNEIYSRCSLVFHKLLIKISENLTLRSRRSINDNAAAVKSYIDRNIYERLSIAQISKHMNLSQSQVNRVFKKSYDITPYDYILTRKIDTAKLLLKNTSLSIKEIAFKLNFADEHYFSNVFLQKTGVRPKRF
ncbi:MAG: AraC family transcriptional regulator [Oscillospiraceae bacterium]|nr:AraC family transcriptional regulator [Oscillospiraceae bacterium]